MKIAVSGTLTLRYGVRKRGQGISPASTKLRNFPVGIILGFGACVRTQAVLAIKANLPEGICEFRLPSGSHL